MNEAYYSSNLAERRKQNYIYISPKDKFLFPFKLKLLFSRRYFHNHPLTFVILKFLLGLIFFTLPIFIFCFTLKQALDYRKYECFWVATLPLKISVGMIMLYILGLIVYKFNQICSSET
jgi:hypothetical protein